MLRMMRVIVYVERGPFFPTSHAFFVNVSRAPGIAMVTTPDMEQAPSATWQSVLWPFVLQSHLTPHQGPQRLQLKSIHCDELTMLFEEKDCILHNNENCV